MGAEVTLLFEESILSLRYVERGVLTIGRGGDISWPGAPRPLVSIGETIEVVALPDVVAAYERDRVVIVIGDVTVLVRPSPPPQRQALRPRFELGDHVATIGVAGAALCLALVVAALPGGGEDVSAGDPHGAPAPEWQASWEGSGSPKGAASTVQRKRHRTARRVSRARANGTLGETVQNNTTLGMMKSVEGIHLASVFGPDSALGSDAENTLAGLVGTQDGAADGVGGLVGPGKGSGAGEGTISLGKLGASRGVDHEPGGGGYGRGFGMCGCNAGESGFSFGSSRVSHGALDKELFRRVIRSHLNEVKFCYEKALIKAPDLYGRVVARFTVRGTGAVVASIVEHSTLDNPAVESCIASAIERWEFPPSRGADVVTITYPFVLKAAGAE